MINYLVFIKTPEELDREQVKRGDISYLRSLKEDLTGYGYRLFPNDAALDRYFIIPDTAQPNEYGDNVDVSGLAKDPLVHYCIQL